MSAVRAGSPRRREHMLGVVSRSGPRAGWTGEPGMVSLAVPAALSSPADSVGYMANESATAAISMDDVFDSNRQETGASRLGTLPRPEIRWERKLPC